MSEIGLFEAIYSARSLRRLKPDPVPEALITKILDAAIRAPSAGNAQNWAFVVVRDPEQRRKLGAVYRKASEIAAAMYAVRGRPAHLTEQQFARMLGAGGHLWEHIGEAPVLLVPCQHLPVVPPRESLPPDIAAGYETNWLTPTGFGRQHLPCCAEYLVACPRPRSRHRDHHQPHPLRGGGQDPARHPRRRRDLCPDADRLAPREIGPRPAAGRRRSSYADRWGTPWPG